MLLGIDLGTTRTVVAHSDRGNFPVLAFESPNGDLLDHFPTVVAARDGELRFGPAAAVMLGEPGWVVLRSFKRLLATSDAGPDTPVEIGDTVVTLAELLIGFLSALREGIHASLGTSAGPLQAMVATPAGAHSTWRFVTLEAFGAAGFEVVGVLDEPSAAAVEYSHRFARHVSGSRHRVLIYDLGGGTFDASLVDLNDGGHTVLHTRGLTQLGGDDFDHVILDLALDAAGLSRAALSAVTTTVLLEHIRACKETVHPNTRNLHVELGAHLLPAERAATGIDEEALVTLSLKKVYAAVRSLVEQTLDTVAEVVPRAGGAFDDEGLSGVYVVGGASSLPVVARTLREAFGRRVRRSTSPSASTAIGLAVAAVSNLTLTRRLGRHFGVFRELGGGARISFDPIFDERTPLGAGGAPELVRRYRPAHDIGHYRFAECSDVADDGSPAGDLVPQGQVRFAFDRRLRGTALEALPVNRGGPGPLVEERWSVDDAGVVKLTITDLDDGYQQSFKLAARN